MTKEVVSGEGVWTPSSFRRLLNNPMYTTVMIGTASFFLMSILIHLPLSNSPVYYSDIVYSFFYGRNGAVVSGIPYVTYLFEYPPVCGLIVWLGGWLSRGNFYIFFTVETAILLAFDLLLAHITFQFLDRLKIGFQNQLLYLAFAPSILFYGSYNFDLIQAFFTIFSFYLFMARGKTSLSALSLGLAISTKISPILLVPLFWQELRSFRKILKFGIVVAATVAATNLPFMLANFKLWLAGYQFLQNWGLEDSFLVWVFPNAAMWGLAKIISFALIAISSILTYALLKSKPLLVRGIVITGIFILFSYIATPQMNISILPFFALVPLIPLSLFYLFEISNIGIIITWFAFPPSTMPGVAQTFAILRQIYLAFILGITIFTNKKSDSAKS